MSIDRSRRETIKRRLEREAQPGGPVPITLPSPRKRGGDQQPPASRKRRQPAPDRGAATMLSLRMIALKQLRVSPLNVRETINEQDVIELAANIAACGLKQNLVVVPDDDLIDGVGYGVVAGGLRLRALLHNAEAGLISLDEQVPCLLEVPAEARATSLSENLYKFAMNPADEVVAFATIVAEHANEPDPVAYTARRFAVTERHVEQRLKLAALAPEILDALRAGAIRIDAASAYAGFDDHALQLAVFKAEEARQFGERHAPRNVREQLRGRTYPASDPRVAYIGIDAYLAAGGRVSADLFMGELPEERFLDPAIVDRLVRTKAEAELPVLAEKDGFARGLLTKTLTAAPVWPSPPAGYRMGGGAPSDTAIAYILPAYDVRPTAIGIYGLRFESLAPIGWFVPIAAPAPAAPPADDRVDMVGYAETIDARDEAPSDARSLQEWPAPTPPRSRPGDRLRLAAARIVVERALGHALDDRARMPGGDGFVPAIAEAEDDRGMIEVAVLIRVSRAEWEATFPDAEAQLVEEDDCNDYVAAAEGEPVESGGGGELPTFHRMRSAA